MKKSLILFAIDFVAAAVIFLFVWIFNYTIPQKGVQAQSLGSAVYGSKGDTTENSAESVNSADENELTGNKSLLSTIQSIIQNTQGTAENLPSTKVKLSSQDWRQKFADKFSKEVISTPSMYSSPNVSIKLTYKQYDSGSLDQSDSGKHT